MRFSTENKALDYLIGKKVKDAANPVISHTPRSRKESKEKYAKWIERKRFMFSPQEFEALQGKIQNQSVRDHYGNVFVDCVEDKPRRQAIIIVEADQKDDANTIAKQIDIVGGDQTFSGPGLSPTGKSPATHYGCSWNCSSSEYDFLVENFTVYDGEKVSFNSVLDQLGLRRVRVPEMTSEKL